MDNSSSATPFEFFNTESANSDFDLFVTADMPPEHPGVLQCFSFGILGPNSGACGLIMLHDVQVFIPIMPLHLQQRAHEYMPYAVVAQAGHINEMPSHFVLGKGLTIEAGRSLMREWRAYLAPGHPIQMPTDDGHVVLWDSKLPGLVSTQPATPDGPFGYLMMKN